MLLLLTADANVYDMYGFFRWLGTEGRAESDGHKGV